MRKKIRKKVVLTKIECAEILVENECIKTSPLISLELLGDFSTTTKAEKVARQYYKGKNVVVTKIYKRTQIREIDLETFIENSIVIEEN